MCHFSKVQCNYLTSTLHTLPLSIGAFHGKVNLSVQLKILEFIPETYFMTTTNRWNISNRFLTNSFTHFESIMAKLAVSIINQLANRYFCLILNSYNVFCNHTSSHVFLPQNTCKLSNLLFKDFCSIPSHIQHNRQPETQLIHIPHITKFISTLAPSQAPSLNYLKTCFLFQYNQYYDRVKLLFPGFITNARNFLFKQCLTSNHFKVMCEKFSFRRVYIHFSLLYAFWVFFKMV